MIYKITLPRDFSGSRYGLDFKRSVATTEDGRIALRLSAKKGFIVEGLPSSIVTGSKEPLSWEGDDEDEDENPARIEKLDFSLIDAMDEKKDSLSPPNQPEGEDGNKNTNDPPNLPEGEDGNKNTNDPPNLPEGEDGKADADNGLLNLPGNEGGKTSGDEIAAGGAAKPKGAKAPAKKA